MTDEELNAKFAVITSRLDALVALINDGNERLSNHLTAIREDIAVSMASADRAVRVADNTRDEVRGLNDILSAMQRQIRRLNNAMFTDGGGKDG